MKTTKLKIIFQGSHMDLLEFDKPIGFDFTPKGKVRRTARLADDDVIKNPAECISKSRSRLRKILKRNGWQYFNSQTQKPHNPYFYTFTFAKSTTSFDVAHPIWKNFIKRFNYYCFKKTGKKLCYICVPEFQKDVDFYGKIKPDGGSVHYHAVFLNMPHITDIFKTFQKLWAQGSVVGKKIKNLDHLANYVAKYIRKDFDKKHKKFRKRYFCSRGLKKPEASLDHNRNLKVLDRIDLSKCKVIEHEPFVSLDGREIKKITLQFPDGFDTASFLTNKASQP